MGCNTSSEPKVAEDKGQKERENQANHTETKENHDDQKQEKADTDPSEVQAATKIQAVFRGHKTRKTMSMKAAKPSNATKQPEKEPEPSKAELEAEFRKDDKELCHAATKIQASFRGHQARKQTQAEKDKELQDLQDKEDIEKIDLTDPDLNKAATRIQASFRGHKVRKDGDGN